MTVSTTETATGVLSLPMSTEFATLLTFDDVQIEAQVAIPAHPVAGAVLSHPHPQQGGTMENGVVKALFDALPGAGVAVVRFNFRGTGGSGGTHQDGQGERFDIIAALDHLAGIVPDKPIAAIGYSFGAVVTLAVNDPRIAGWAAIAPPLTTLGDLLDPVAEVAVDKRPKVIIQPAHDQFTKPDVAKSVVAAWANSRVDVVSNSDHFLAGRTGEVVFRVLAFIDELTAASG
jgi:uncharacterized protein